MGEVRARGDRETFFKIALFSFRRSAEGRRVGDEGTRDEGTAELVFIFYLICMLDSGIKLTLVPLTSKIENKYEDDILIQKDSRNNLNYDCLIKVHHISIFDKSRFIRKIGEVDEEILIKVKEYLKKHFDI